MTTYKQFEELPCGGKVVRVVSAEHRPRQQRPRQRYEQTQRRSEFWQRPEQVQRDQEERLKRETAEDQLLLQSD